MGYIQSIKHFENYISKIIREENISNCYGLSFYNEKIFANGKADEYCWDVKQNLNYLTRDGVLEWLNKKFEKKEDAFKYIVQHNFTPEFIECLNQLDRTPGVYTFWKKNKILYIGMSTNLRDRIPSSFAERFKNIDEIIKLKYVKCKTKTDAAILEIYFINKYKPVFNAASKYEDDLTFKIEPIPKFEKTITCNNASKI